MLQYPKQAKCLPIWENEAFLKKIKAAFFIPPKYRVYHHLQENNPLEFLQKNYGEKSIPVIDLTNILKDEARKKLALEEYVYWRDDTHWNSNGISVVSEYIAKQIK